MTAPKVTLRLSPSVRLALLALWITATACGQRQIAGEVADFDKAVATGAAAIASYYSALNDQETRLYFELLQLDPAFEVGNQIRFPLIAGSGQKEIWIDSPLKRPPFPIKAIQARIGALKELSAYAGSLASLAGAGSPGQFQSGVATLKDRLLDLHDTFQSLKEDAGRPDSRADKFLGPISTFIGIAGKWLLEERRWREIREAILEAEPPVNTILDGIAADLDDYVKPVLDTGADDLYTTAIVYYNLRRKELSPDQRASILKQIYERKTAFDAASGQKPSSVPRQMKQAHLALVKAARSDRAPADLAALKRELERFKDDVEQLREAVAILLGHREDRAQ